MTIVAFHYTKDSIFAIADGLISKGSTRVVEQNRKIISFNPMYKIPRVSLGRLSGFTEYRGGTFCLAYAGNYSIIATALSRFLSIINDKLVLDRNDNGTPTVYQREDEGRALRDNSYWDNYNFSDDEIIPITVNFLANILQCVVSSVCSDFSKNAMQDPDIELILFGEQIVRYERENKAQIILCKEFCEFSPIIERFSVLPWSLVCIGDSSVIPGIVAAIEADPLYHQSFPVGTDRDLDAWMTRSTVQINLEKNRTKLIRNNILSLIQKNSGTIGGDCTIASSGWASDLSLFTIKRENIEDELAD